MQKTISYIIWLILLVLAQIFIFDNINIMNYVTAHVYIMFIMIMPMEIRNAPLILIGFGLGVLIDLANGSMGLCAMATTLIAFLRPMLLHLVAGRDVVNTGGIPSIRTMRPGLYLLFIFMMTLVYNLTYFLIESMTLTNITFTMLRILASTVSTSVIIFLLHFIIIRKTTSTWH